MQVECLVLNVSDQCIPNLVAIETYSPRTIIWVYTPEKKDVLQRLQAASGVALGLQLAWEVNARDSLDLAQVLDQKFSSLQVRGLVVYHLTSGTKSMALQGMQALVQQAHLQSMGVVMDPRSQYFDAVLPKAINDQAACASLGFSQILRVHGSSRRDESGRSMESILPHYDNINRLRLLNGFLMRDLKDIDICSKLEAENNSGYFYSRKKTRLSDAVRQGLEVAQDIGVIKALHIKQDQFRFAPVFTDNPIAYIRNMWMEDWVAVVLAKHNDGHWKGGFSGIKISIKAYDNYQEFDFLGARKNRLVYWSCKNNKEVKADNLFEIDALRDEVGGRDFHVAGLLHTAKVKAGLKNKAQRLGVAMVNVFDNDAEEKLVNISCR